MRITGGLFRGRNLISPEGLHTRPTGDRARQAIFNILNHAGWRTRDLIEDAAVMDVFCGTGALGLEALSQGAAHAVFIDNDAAALKACRDNIAAFKVEDRTLVQKTDALLLPQRPPQLPPRGLVFLDPPYGKGFGARAISTLVKKDWLADNAICVLEMAKKEPEETPKGFEMMDERTYGVALVRFLLRS